MQPEILIWAALFLPLLSAVVITCFTRRDPKLSAGLSIGAVVLSFLLCLIFAAWSGVAGLRESAVTWLSVGDLEVDFGLRLDALSVPMTLIVTGVASLIHIYSWAYMRGEAGFARYFACLSLFTFSMLGIVVSYNFLQLFIFWELVGLSSYLLIGFWFEKPAAADAGKKAFIMNRLGDFGFLLGIIMVWSTLGSLNFKSLQTVVASQAQAWPAVATLAGILIFCGAMGKSAQFPLHVWLPDAMEGPTPVSALIHAATMVAAGVYMLCRVEFLLSGPALVVIAWIGGFTALLAAVIAIQQNDIKRILAYSTLSQLGYMVMSVGLSGAPQAMFHLSTHAFFKALLFLGAGSVIVAMHHEQGIWKMGSLRTRMPATFWTFLVGTLALSGVWPLSGFFSKDSLLAHALKQNVALFVLGLGVAVLTSFYMFRLVFVVFGGAARGESAGHARESEPILLWPLRILAILSALGGIIGIEGVFERQFHGGEHHLEWWQQLTLPFAEAPVVAVLGLLAAAAGFAVAYALYARAKEDPLPAKLGVLARWMADRFYFDELYQATVIRAHDFLAAAADVFDRWIVAGLVVRGTHGTTELAGRLLRRVQTGNLQTYAFLFALGVALVLLFALIVT